MEVEYLISYKNVLCLSIGRVIIALFSDTQLDMLAGASAFQCRKNHDVSIHIIPVNELPAVSAAPCGDDKLFCYYRSNSLFYELAKPGTEGSVSLAVYPKDFQYITLYVNEGKFPGAVYTADKVLQLLPMNQLLVYFKTFLLHSSRIVVGGKAILFTAPSRTGKTTQACLWQKFGGAKIAGNDRTLLWRKDGGIVTSGYPVDGSSPLYSNEEFPLGAVVVLRQGTENCIQRMTIVSSLRCLMEQTALDAWNVEERVAAQEFWIELTENYPVYLLHCSPDKRAVRCLKDQLERDEVISFDIDT